VALLSVDLTGEGLSLARTLFNVLKVARLHMALPVPNLDLDPHGLVQLRHETERMNFFARISADTLPRKEPLHAHRNPDFLLVPGSLPLCRSAHV
jgi:hypothetical protein